MNILDVVTINGKTFAQVLATSAGDIDLVENVADSGKVLKINSVYISNVDNVTAAPATLKFDTFFLIKEVSVPANSTLIAISKNEAIYLEEGQALTGYTDNAGDLEIVISYEEIS